MHGTLIFQVYHMIKSIQSCHGHKSDGVDPTYSVRADIVDARGKFPEFREHLLAGAVGGGQVPLWSAG